MERPRSAGANIPAISKNSSPLLGVSIQSGEANPVSPASNGAKVKQFAALLDKQQQVTALGIKYETAVFDAAQNVELNATYSEPAKAAKL